MRSDGSGGGCGDVQVQEKLLDCLTGKTHRRHLQTLRQSEGCEQRPPLRQTRSRYSFQRTPHPPSRTVKTASATGMTSSVLLSLTLLRSKLPG